MINGNSGSDMKIRLLATICLSFLLAACGSMSLENKRVDYKATAVEVPSLEVPPDLTAPEAENQYAIPNAGNETASYSDFA